MSMVNTVLTGAVIWGVATVWLRMVLPEPVPFVVHSLAYSEGVVTQDRTITTDEPAFFAQWTATVENADTGQSLRRCEGSGANGYPPGRMAVSFTLEEWTGRDNCTVASLLPGHYTLRATWRWGEESTAMKSEPFEVTR